MRDYARLCYRTKKYAQRANACAAPFYAQHARAHAQNYAPTALVLLEAREPYALKVEVRWCVEIKCPKK